MTENATARTVALAVVMGVAGSGKSTVAPLVAQHFGVAYRDADEFHPQSNVDKMHAGIPLTDEDRKPWLAAIATWLDDQRDVGAIVTCSALKRSYRDQLRAHIDDLPFLHLAGDIDVATARVGGRSGHFMPASLVVDQYQTLEPLQDDEVGVAADFALPVNEIAAIFEDFLAGLGAQPTPQPRH